jgi:hypothetical protein
MKWQQSEKMKNGQIKNSSTGTGQIYEGHFKH